MDYSIFSCLLQWGVRKCRSLPAGWLGVNDTKSYPLVHVAEVSTWLPGLRTLSLGSNNIDMTLYDALQSIVGLASLQTVDFSNNTLSGTFEESFTMYYCQEGTSGACDSAGVKTGASSLTILLLASNTISGELQMETLPASLNVLTASDNLLEGRVPDSFSQLLAFFAGKLISVRCQSPPQYKAAKLYSFLPPV